MQAGAVQGGLLEKVRTLVPPVDFIVELTPCLPARKGSRYQIGVEGAPLKDIEVADSKRANVVMKTNQHPLQRVRRDLSHDRFGNEDRPWHKVVLHRISQITDVVRD